MVADGLLDTDPFEAINLTVDIEQPTSLQNGANL
jgi:hypothetical protein